jgi:hypothetical protein
MTLETLMSLLRADVARTISIGLFAIGLAITLAYVYLIRRLTRDSVKTMPRSLVVLVSIGSLVESIGIVGFMLGGGFRR